MKRSLPSFITVISDNKYEVLEEIIESKFYQFRTFYWLLKDYSDFITKLKYKETKKNILKIDVSLTKVNMAKVMDEINDYISTLDGEDDIVVMREGRVLHIEIARHNDGESESEL